MLLFVEETSIMVLGTGLNLFFFWVVNGRPSKPLSLLRLFRKLVNHHIVGPVLFLYLWCRCYKRWCSKLLPMYLICAVPFILSLESLASLSFQSIQLFVRSSSKKCSCLFEGIDEIKVRYIPALFSFRKVQCKEAIWLLLRSVFVLHLSQCRVYDATSIGLYAKLACYLGSLYIRPLKFIVASWTKKLLGHMLGNRSSTYIN